MMTNFSQCKRYKIELKALSDFTQIKSLFKSYNIQRYIYIIRHRDTIIKIGISHKIQEWADRIYTQIGHMPGWSRPLLQRSKKTKQAIDTMIAKLPGTFHKDDVEIEVIDFTDYDFFNTSNPYAEMQNAEEELKNQYFEQFGCYPIGNIKQEKIRFVPDKSNFEKLFSFE